MDNDMYKYSRQKEKEKKKPNQTKTKHNNNNKSCESENCFIWENNFPKKQDITQLFMLNILYLLLMHLLL